MAAISKSEGIKGVSEELLAGSKASLVKKAESKLSVACNAEVGDVASIQALLTKFQKIKGISESVLETAKQTMVKIVEEKLRAAVGGDSAADIRAAISEAEAVDGVDSDLLGEAQKRLQELDKKCCCVVL